MKIISMLIAAFWSGKILANTSSQVVPEGFQLSCWDQSYLYNTLKISAEEDLLTFTLHGRYLWLSGRSQSPSMVTFLSPREKCRVAKNDSKTMSCEVESMELQVTERSGQKSSVAIPKVSVKLRKVEEVGFRQTVTGYEIMLDQKSGAPLLKQKYFLGFQSDETGNCELSSINLSEEK